MKTLRVLVILCIMAMTSRITSGQSNSTWQFESTTFVPRVLSFIGQVSANGTYFASSPIDLQFLNLNLQTYDYYAPHYTDALPRWQNNTMLYREYNRPENYGGHAECTDGNRITFGFYDAPTQNNQIFCLVPPKEYVDSGNSDVLDRYPFDDRTTLFNRRYLVQVALGQWLDLKGLTPTSVKQSDTLGWFAQGNIWWNAQSHRPMAVANVDTQFTNSWEITSQAVSICPLESDDCQPIFSVQDYIHGSLYDVLISPDGQTILWTSGVYEAGQPIIGGTGIVTVVDIAAFATDVQSRTTTEIFRLSAHNPIPHSRGIYAIWSEDGQTLAIKLSSTAAETVPPEGLLLVKFSRT
ncbi:MAG: PD40 domain-containing protein [Anaerolineae bacterium]|nr:PD40 domain-containing protein [Anaerolineae bacterium]